uniref:Armadillo segment polarity protein n=1 Tax=Lygus hesperus TaxID=30085 RepID=A0A0A9YK06_LYGHE
MAFVWLVLHLLCVMISTASSSCWDSAWNSAWASKMKDIPSFNDGDLLTQSTSLNSLHNLNHQRMDHLDKFSSCLIPELKRTVKKEKRELEKMYSKHKKSSSKLKKTMQSCYPSQQRCN